MKRFTLLLAFALAFSFVKAQEPGALDPTFGTNGITQIQIGDDAYLVDELHGIEIQDDGKTIAFGSSRDGGQKRMAIARFNEDGTLDASFGNNGIVIITPSSAYGNFVMDAEAMPDGKLIVCGRIFHSDGTEPSSLPVLIKLNSDGSLDSSFGDNGMAIGHFNVNILPEAMVVQDDGKIVFGGNYNDQMMTMRYNEDGSLDTSYGNDGFCVLSEELTNSGTSYVKGLDIQADGQTVIVGFCHSASLPKWTIARIDANGRLDNTFGNGGLVIMSAGYGNDYATSVLIQDDGKILVGGNSWDANEPALQYSFAIARLNNDGTLDSSFANSGLYRYRLWDEGENYITKLALSPSNEIYASFSVKYEPQMMYGIGVLCLDMDGAPCADFGENGYSLISLGGSNNSMDLGLQPDGKIIMGAECFSPAGDGARFTLARFMPNSTIPTFTAPNDLFAAIDGSEVTLIWPYEAPDKAIRRHKPTEASELMAKAPRDINPASYKIYRSTSNSNYETIATIAAEALPMTYVDDLNGMADGTYFYQVTAVYEHEGEMHESAPANAYGSNDNYVTVVYQHDGLSNEGNFTIASIYPNPAKNHIHISAKRMQQISVINILGQLVYAKNTENDSEIIDLSQFKAGIYMINVESENGTSTQRISVVR